MAQPGLPLRVATLLTGLLECIGFAGVLFGWASLVFVFKTEHYFEELCEPAAGLASNATGQAGKGSTGFSKEAEPGPQEVGRGRADSISCSPFQPFYGKRSVSKSRSCLGDAGEGSTSFQALLGAGIFRDSCILRTGKLS